MMPGNRGGTAPSVTVPVKCCRGGGLSAVRPPGTRRTVTARASPPRRRAGGPGPRHRGPRAGRTIKLLRVATRRTKSRSRSYIESGAAGARGKSESYPQAPGPGARSCQWPVGPARHRTTGRTQDDVGPAHFKTMYNILCTFLAAMQESTLRSQARSEMVFQSFVPEISSFAETQSADPASLWDHAAMFLSPRKEEASIRIAKTCRDF
jgi:hypothetical protein